MCSSPERDEDVHRESAGGSPAFLSEAVPAPGTCEMPALSRLLRTLLLLSMQHFFFGSYILSKYIFFFIDTSKYHNRKRKNGVLNRLYISFTGKKSCLVLIWPTVETD